MIFGIETEKNQEISSYLQKIKDNMNRNKWYKDAGINNIIDKDKLIIIFNIPIPVAFEVVQGFLLFAFTGSVIIRFLLGFKELVFFQILLIGLMLLVFFFVSDYWFYSLFKYTIKKKTLYKGDFKFISPGKVLKRLYF